MKKLYKLIFEINLLADDWIKAYSASRNIIKIDEENIGLVNYDFRFDNLICLNEDFTEEDEKMVEKVGKIERNNPINSLVTCQKCGLQWSIYPHKAKNNTLCVNCRKEKKMDAFTEMLERMYETGNVTEKVQCVVDLLNEDIDMKTRKIMTEVDEMWEGRITVSERYVQRIRKWYKEKVKEKKEEDKAVEKVTKTKEKEEESWVFDSGEGLDDWQINVLNMANEGGWSIQQIAEQVEKSEDKVRDTLEDFRHMYSNEVLDEDDNDIYEKQMAELNSDIPPEVTPFTDDVPHFVNLEDKEEVNIRIDKKEKINDEFWEVEIDCVTACSKTENEIDVFMSKKAKTISFNYMKWAKNREWLAYLIGDKDDKGFNVHDLYLPDQRTSSVLVDKVVAEKYNQLKVIGVIHSHHEMGAGDADKPSFSGHDANFINGNHDLSLLAGKDENKGFKIVGIARAKTPCGALMKVKANVKAMKEKLSEDESALKNEFFKKVFDNKEKESKKKVTDNSVVVRYPSTGVQQQYHFTNNPNVKGG